MILYQKKQLGGALRAARKAGKAASKWVKKSRKSADWKGFDAPEVGNDPKPMRDFYAPEVGNDPKPNAFDDYLNLPRSQRDVDTKAFQGNMPRAVDQYSARLKEIDDEMATLATDWNRAGPRDFAIFEDLRHERNMLKRAMGLGF